MDFNIYIENLEKELIKIFKEENKNTVFLDMQLINVLQNGLINNYAITYEKNIKIKINKIVHNFKVKVTDFNYFIQFKENGLTIYYLKDGNIKVDKEYIKQNNKDLNEFTLKRLERLINNNQYDDIDFKATINQKNYIISDLDSNADIDLYKNYIEFFKLVSDYQLMINNIETFLGYNAVVTNNELVNIFENKNNVIGDLNITMGIKNMPVTLKLNNKNITVNANIAIKFISQVTKLEDSPYLKIITEEINDDNIVGILTKNLSQNIEITEKSQIKLVFDIDLIVPQEELVYSLEPNQF